MKLHTMLPNRGWDYPSKKTKQKIKDTIISLDHTRPNARKKLASYIKPILYHHREMIEKTKLTKEQENEIIRKEHLGIDMHFLLCKSKKRCIINSQMQSSIAIDSSQQNPMKGIYF